MELIYIFIYIIIFIILFYLIIKVNQLSTEKFDATTDAVKTIYKLDVEAIRNLSSIASNLVTTTNYTVPANLIVANSINASSATISGILQSNSAIILGNLTAGSATISGNLIAGSATISNLIANTINNTGTTTISGILQTTNIKTNNINISGDINISGSLILPNKWTITTDTSGIYFKYDNTNMFSVGYDGVFRIGVWLIGPNTELKELHFNRPADNPYWNKYMAIQPGYTFWWP